MASPIKFKGATMAELRLVDQALSAQPPQPQSTPSPLPIATPAPQYYATPQPSSYQTPRPASTPTPPGYSYGQETPSARPVQTPAVPAPTFYGFNPASYPTAPKPKTAAPKVSAPTPGVTFGGLKRESATPEYWQTPVPPQPKPATATPSAVVFKGAEAHQAGWNFGEMPTGWKYEGGINPMPVQQPNVTVTYQEQGKGKGLNANLNKTMQQAMLEQYGRQTGSAWNPYWNALYNAYGGGMLPDTFNPLAQATFDYYRLGIPGASPTMLPDRYNGLIDRWQGQNVSPRRLPDTYDFQVRRLAEQLTALLQSRQGGASGRYPTRYRSYGGGGGWDGYGENSYTPSWFNGLLSWRI